MVLLFLVSLSASLSLLLASLASLASLCSLWFVYHFSLGIDDLATVLESLAVAGRPGETSVGIAVATAGIEARAVESACLEEDRDCPDCGCGVAVSVEVFGLSLI